MSSIEGMGTGIELPMKESTEGVPLTERARQVLAAMGATTSADETAPPRDETETPPEVGGEEESPSEEEIALRAAFARMLAMEMFREVIFFGSEEESGVPELSIDI